MGRTMAESLGGRDGRTAPPLMPRRKRSPHAEEPRSDSASTRVCAIVRGVSKHGRCDRGRPHMVRDASLLTMRAEREQSVSLLASAVLAARVERSETRGGAGPHFFLMA